MNVLQRLNTIKDLPTLPEIIFSIQSIMHSEEGNAATMARVVRNDPSLTAKILRVANSTFFCPINQRISSVSRAIARIGFNEVGNLTMAASMVRQFGSGSGITDYKEFWRHCMRVAHLNRHIGATGTARVPLEEQQYLFLAGLLHDLGILIYDQYFNEEFKQIVEDAIRNEQTYLSAERRMASKETHAKIGGALLEIWKMDPYIISGVRFHHDYAKAPELHRRIAEITCISEHIANTKLGSFEGNEVTVDEDLFKSLDLCADNFESMVQSVDEEMDKSNLFSAMGISEDNSTLRMI